jgi:hypothetical protein
MRRSVLVGMLGIALAVSSASAGNAVTAAAACQWTGQDLPLVSSTNFSRVVAVSKNELILGETFSQGLVWQHGQIRNALIPNTPTVKYVPRGINSAASVVGWKEVFSGGDYTYQAFKYAADPRTDRRVYLLLPTPADELSFAVGINDSGEVVGHVAKKATPDVRRVVVWPANGTSAYREVGPGNAIGIGADGTVLTSEGALVGRDGSQHLVSASGDGLIIDDQRVFGPQFTGSGVQIVEWDLTGRQVRVIPGGIDPIGANTQGTFFGTHGAGISPGVYRDGAWTDIQADKLPRGGTKGDITDNDTLIANYRDGDGNDHAAQWTCG